LEQYEREKITNTLAVLRTIKFFNEFSELEMEKFHFYLELKDYTNGTRIYSVGDEPDGIFFIKNGSTKVSKSFCNDLYGIMNISKDDVEIDVTNCKELDVFGETEILSKMKERQFQLQATADCSLIFCHKLSFYFIATPYSLKKKLASNDKKVEKLTNLYKFKLMNLSNSGRRDKSKKIHVIERDIPAYGSNDGGSTKYLDVNFHGFAEDARKYGKQDFERSLDNLAPRINKLKFLSKFGGKSDKINYEINQIHHSPNVVSSSKDLKQITCPKNMKTNEDNFTFTRYSSPVVASNYLRAFGKTRTSVNLPSIGRKK